MAADDKRLIPTPDNSGSANTQKAGHSDEVVSISVESPISMGRVVNGLATEGHSGLNRQASLITGALLETQIRKLESTENEVKKLLPQNAVLEAENKTLKQGKKRGAAFNSLGLAMMTSGIAVFGMQVSSQGILSLSLGTAVAAMLFLFGILLQLLVIFTSLSGDK